ncbi:MAG: 4Fe-4S dicluster domain-containing protein [Agathobacter sp.]|nr:4Fe-4S dicluster domain-containing protein [Agathobacter sp.]MBR2403882.1 4Fe-4S dicluster domain-containing protein [Lachnospiraceae bacterium]
MEQKSIPDLRNDKVSCCGCAACYSICPVGAIAMMADEKGFLYPQIDEGKCIRCQRCINVCAFKKDKA